MIPHLRNPQGIILDPVDQAMLVGDPPGPISAQDMLQGFGFADPGERVAPDLVDQVIDAGQGLVVLALPVQVVLSGPLGEDDFHSVSSRAVPPPCSSSATDSSKHRTLAGLRRR